MGRELVETHRGDDITDSDSHPPLPHSPFPRLCLFPKLPPTYASNIHPGPPSTCHSHVHICHGGLPAPAKLGRRTCSDRGSAGRSGGGGSHMLLCWIPPLLLHKDTLTLLQCSIGCCCATALKIPRGQREENLNVEKLFRWETRSWTSLSVTWGWESALQRWQGQSMINSAAIIYEMAAALVGGWPAEIQCPRAECSTGRMIPSLRQRLRRRCSVDFAENDSKPAHIPSRQGTMHWVINLLSTRPLFYMSV